MSILQHVMTKTGVFLLKDVIWGPNRLELKAMAEAAGKEAAYESGWDNYSTAAQLRWKEKLNLFAAAARFGSENDPAMEDMKNILLRGLQHTFNDSWPDRSDMGETEAFEMTNADRALSHVLETLSAEDTELLKEELRARGIEIEPSPQSGMTVGF